MPSTNRFGSKVGFDTNARMSPVAGSIAISAPRRSPNARSTIFCSSMSTDRIRLLPGRRRLARQGADRAPARRDLDLLDARRAVQLALVALLDADLADVFRPVVDRRIAARFGEPLDALEVARRNAPDVADHVRRDLAERIVAEQPGAQLDAREPEAVGGEARDILVGQARADRNRVEALGLLEQLLEPTAVARLDVHHLRQFVDRLLEVLDLGRGDLQRVRGVVAGDDRAVAVLDQPAVRRDRQDGDPVRLGLFAVGLVLDDLQPREARHQDRECRQHEGARHEHARAKVPHLAFGIAHRRDARPERQFVVRPATAAEPAPSHAGPASRADVRATRAAGAATEEPACKRAGGRAGAPRRSWRIIGAGMPLSARGEPIRMTRRREAGVARAL